MTWSNPAVKKNARTVAYVYGAWCLLNFVLAIFGMGEDAHLALAFTGIPLALLSLYLPNASFLAIVVAAVLGFVQWTALVAWWSTDEPVR